MVEKRGRCELHPLSFVDCDKKDCARFLGLQIYNLQYVCLSHFPWSDKTAIAANSRMCFKSPTPHYTTLYCNTTESL